MTSELVERLSDDTAARTAYEAGGYVNWDRQPEEKKVRHRRIAAAVLGQAADRIEALEAALERLEAANDALCAKRSTSTYLLMIDVDRADVELEALDDARRNARATLNVGEG